MLVSVRMAICEIILLGGLPLQDRSYRRWEHCHLKAQIQTRCKGEMQLGLGRLIHQVGYHYSSQGPRVCPLQCP